METPSKIAKSEHCLSCKQVIDSFLLLKHPALLIFPAHFAGLHECIFIALFSLRRLVLRIMETPSKIAKSEHCLNSINILNSNNNNYTYI